MISLVCVWGVSLGALVLGAVWEKWFLARWLRWRLSRARWTRLDDLRVRLMMRRAARRGVSS